MNKPESCGLSREMIESLAAVCGSELGFTGNIKKFANKMGILVHPKLAGDNMNGVSLTVRNGGTFNMNLPMWTSNEEKFHYMAHNIGHLILHYLVPKFVFGKEIDNISFPISGSNDLIEHEANWFAGAFK